MFDRVTFPPSGRFVFTMTGALSNPRMAEDHQTGRYVLTYRHFVVILVAVTGINIPAAVEAF